MIPTQSPDSTPAQNSARLALVAALASGAAALQAGFLGLPADTWQGAVVFAIMLLIGLAALASLALSRRGRPTLGAWLLMGTAAAGFMGATALVSGLGVALGPGIAILAALAAAQALPPRHITPLNLAGLGAGAACLLLEMLEPAQRIAAPAGLQLGVSVVLAATALLFSFFLFRTYRQFNLRAKLTIILLGITLVPLSLVAFLNDRASRAALTDAARQSLQAAALQTATSVEAFININKEVLSSEAQFPILADFLALPPDQRRRSDLYQDTQALLRSFNNKGDRSRPSKSQYVLIQSYWLIDSRGQIALSTSASEIGQDKSGTDFFRQALGQETSYMSPVEFSRAGAADLFFSARVLSPDDGAPLGVLVARYSGGVFQSLIYESNELAGSGSYAVLFDENFLHLAHGDELNMIFKLAGAPDETRLEQLQAEARAPFQTLDEVYADLPELERGLFLSSVRPFFVASYGGQEQILNQVAVAPVLSQPWRVAYFQPESVFLAPADAQTRSTLLLFMLIALVVAAAAIAVTQIVAGPVARLTAVARQVSAGQLDASAPVESGDEIGVLAQTFNIMVAQLRNLYRDLEANVEARTRQLEAAAEVGRAATSILDTETLLSRALELIRERFGYYHASVFLLDESGEYAVLRESTGEVGQMLKARGHRLKVGSGSIIGWVTANRKPRVASEVGADPVHLKNELLLDTRAEAAVPLRVGERVLGALDVQSTEPDAFGPTDVEALQILADQIAVAIENGRLFGRQQRIIELEQVVASFTSRIHQSTSVETILEIAATELGRALGARRAVVRLQPARAENAEPGNGRQADQPASAD